MSESVNLFCAFVLATLLPLSTAQADNVAQCRVAHTCEMTGICTIGIASFEAIFFGTSANDFEIVIKQDDQAFKASVITEQFEFGWKNNDTIHTVVMAEDGLFTWVERTNDRSDAEMMVHLGGCE